MPFYKFWNEKKAQRQTPASIFCLENLKCRLNKEDEIFKGELLTDNEWTIYFVVIFLPSMW